MPGKSSPVRAAAAALVAIASLALAGCSDDETPSGAERRDAALQVVNGASAQVAVRVDGQLVIPALAPGSVSQTLQLARGSHAVEIETGAMSGATNVQLDSGQVRIVTATGTHATLDARVLPDTASVPAPGTVKLRVVHLAADAPPISVWRTQPGVEGEYQVMFPFTYGSGASSFLQGEPGTWRVWVAPLQATQPRTPGDTVTYTGGPTPELASSGPIVLNIGDVRTAVLLRAADGGLRFEVLAGEP